MDLTEISRDEALELYNSIHSNQLWVMRMLPTGPVDLLPIVWAESFSDVFKSEWFFKNRLTRYYKADVDVIEEIAPDLRELKDRMEKLKGYPKYEEMGFKEKVEQLALDI